MTSIDVSRPMIHPAAPGVSPNAEQLMRAAGNAILGVVYAASDSVAKGGSLAAAKKQIAEVSPAVAKLVTSAKALKELTDIAGKIVRENIAAVELDPVQQKPSAPAPKDELEEEAIPGMPNIPEIEAPVGAIPSNADEFVAYAKGTHSKTQIFSMLAAIQGSAFGPALTTMLGKVGALLPEFSDMQAQLKFFKEMEGVAATALEALGTRQDVASTIKQMDNGSAAGATASKVCANADDIKVLWAMLHLQNAVVG
jgi:hypothetical protein